MSGRSWSILALLALGLLWAVPVRAQNDVQRFRSCSACGMDRKAYGYSRTLVEYADGTGRGFCSLHCAVQDLAENPGRALKVLLVADRETRELLDAEQAVWVMGGRKPGVMTQRAKWAFRSKGAAEAFVKGNGGEIVPWAGALAAAREELGSPPR